MKKKQEEKDPMYLTTEDIARRFRTLASTVRRWRVEGKGPRFIKPGKRVLYHILEVEQFERKHTKRSTVG